MKTFLTFMHYLSVEICLHGIADMNNKAWRSRFSIRLQAKRRAGRKEQKNDNEPNHKVPATAAKMVKHH